MLTTDPKNKFSLFIRQLNNLNISLPLCMIWLPRVLSAQYKVDSLNPGSIFMPRRYNSFMIYSSKNIFINHVDQGLCRRKF